MAWGSTKNALFVLDGLPRPGFDKEPGTCRTVYVGIPADLTVSTVLYPPLAVLDPPLAVLYSPLTVLLPPKSLKLLVQMFVACVGFEFAPILFPSLLL